jgi:bacillithiol system protein YtxJ
MKQWKEITTTEQWQSLLDESKSNPFVLLKHSTRCPVSTNALEEYEQYLAQSPNEAVGYYLVKVIESRPVSNQIAEDTGVTHASPQMLYINWSVTAKHMAAVLD